MHVDNSDRRIISLIDMTHHVKSKFDEVFNENDEQEKIFNYVSNCVDNVIKGFNCTIFAYGQTGSGKTYTMFGRGFDTREQVKGLKRPTQNIDMFLS